MRIVAFLCFNSILFATTLLRAQYAASNFTLISKISPEQMTNGNGAKYSACWGWHQAAKNKEYAIACSQSGTYWVDVTNAATPTVSVFEQGTFTGAIWREAKTYQNYCYVISDDFGNNSLQIFDMQNLPASVTKVYDSDSIFERGHTLWIDGNKLYVASVTYSNTSYSSMNVYSLANPARPLLLRSLNQDHSFINVVHDMFVRNDTVYASCAYQGLYVFKFLTASNTFSLLGSLSTYTASGYNHSSALTPNGKTLVFTDEVPSGLPIKFANVSNLSNIQVLATHNQFPQTVPHNPFMVNNQYCFMSSYADGLQLYDISNPSAPVLAGYFDTFPQGGGNNNIWSSPYAGQWGAYPFFPSKNIFALDQTNGIFMLKSKHYTNDITQVPSDYTNNSFEMNIFPNPANNEIQFNLPAEFVAKQINVNIVDATGRLVMVNLTSEKDNAYTRKIDIENLSKGIYFLQIYSGQKIIAGKKFVISK